MIIPVLIQNVDEWSTFIPKKIFVLILVQYEELKNGIIHTKSALLLKETFIISRIISVLQEDVHKTKKLCMLT